MGKVCCGGVNQALNNPTLMGERIMHIGSIRRQVEGGLFSLEKMKVKAMVDIAEDEKTMAKVKGMIEQRIEKDMMTKVYDMNAKVKAIVQGLVVRVYNYILNNNIEKLMKADKKIEDYIDRIYPRCFIDHLANYNSEQFKEEVINMETGERAEDSPEPTSAFERILHYMNLVDSSFWGLPSQPDHKDQKTMMLRQFMLAGILCQLYQSDPFTQAEMYREDYWHVAAYHLLEFAKSKCKRFTMVQFRQHAEKQALRSLSWYQYNSKNLVQHYNLIVEIRNDKEKEERRKKEAKGDKYVKPELSHEEKVELAKDNQDMERIKSLCNGMLDYYAWKQDSSEIHEAEFNEVVDMTYIMDDKVYHLALLNVFKDISNDPFIYPYKFVGLAVIVLNLCLKIKDEGSHFSTFASADDLNSCLMLMKKKMDSMLVDTEGTAIQDCLDSFNLILQAMVSVGVQGVREANVAEIQKSLEVFQKVCSHRDPLPLRLLGLTDTYSGLDRSLYLKTLFTNEFLLRIGKARPAWTSFATKQMRFGHFLTAVGGIASVVKGVANYDLGKISEGAGNIAGVVKFYTRDRDQFNSIDMMNQLSTTDFPEFKKTFFDNTLEENKDMIHHQKQEAYTYYLISTLDKVVRNRTLPFENRMEAISLLKYIVMNTNFENKTPLQYHVTENERLIIRQFLLLYTQMPEEETVDADHNNMIKQYAQKMLYSMFPDTEEGNAECDELIKNNADKVKRLFRFEDRRPPKTNVLLKKAMGVKVPIISLFSDLRNSGKHYYEKELRTQTLIDIKAHGIGQPQSQALLHDIIPQFLKNTQEKVLLIQGKGGSGKTTLLHQLHYNQWVNYSLGNSEYLPIYLSLGSTKKTQALLESALSAFNGSKFAGGIKSSTLRVVLLVDSYDEMRQPVNLWNQNNLDEWEGTIKVIVACRGEYLVPFANYYAFFIPHYDENAFSDYVISDVDKDQITSYVIKHHQTTSDRSQAEEESMRTQLIKQVGNFSDICTTPYMLSILVGIMPRLQEKLDDLGVTGEGAKLLGLNAVYETFTRNLFVANLTEILFTNPQDLPQGFDLFSSFFNYSCSFAVALWLEGQTYCQIDSNNYPFPKRNPSPSDEKFKQLFLNDAKTRYARAGSPIIEESGIAKFDHSSIQNYFVARVLLQDLKNIDPKNESIRFTYLNDKVLQAKDQQDYEILSFIWGIIKEYNRRDGPKSDYGIPQKLATYIEQFIEELADNDEDPIYVNNIMIISSKIARCFGKIQFKEEQLDAVKKIMTNHEIDSCFKAEFGHHASKFFNKIDMEASIELGKSALAYQLGGITYDGDMKADRKTGRIMAEGNNGVLVFANGDQYRGGFKANKYHGRGDYLYSQQRGPNGESLQEVGDLESYEGQFANGMKEGEGTQRYQELRSMRILAHEGDVELAGDHEFGQQYYQGQFHENLPHGKGTKYFDGDNTIYNGDFKTGKRSGQGNLFVNYENHQWVYQGGWKNNQPDGKGKVIIGKYGRLTDTTFEGTFVAGAASGDLILNNGSVIAGELRIHFTRGFQEHGIKFYTQQQIEGGADKSVIFYSLDGEDSHHLREFKKMKDANQFYKTLKIKENCSAKVHLHDLKILPQPNKNEEDKKKGKTDLDVERLIASAIKLGYHEQRDKNNQLIMQNAEGEVPQGHHLKQANKFSAFLNNLGSQEYVGAYDLNHEEEQMTTAEKFEAQDDQ